MFDDVCMACGIYLKDDSDRCQSADKASSSNTVRVPRSRSSSVFASPFLTPGAAATYIPDIPPLVLPKPRTTSSSTSTTSDVASVLEYESDADVGVAASGAAAGDEPKGESMFDLPPLGAAPQESAGVAVAVPLASRRTPISALPLSFNRLPAPADTRSLAPALHMYAQSHTHARARPGAGGAAAAAAASPEDRPAARSLLAALPALPTRKRASLPAYFSHLTLTSHALPSPPTLAHINVHVDVATDRLATPKARTEARHYGHQRGKSEQLPELWRDGSRASRVPVPGREREGDDQERGRARGRQLEDEVKLHGENERRGRSRVVTPRLKILNS
ncbi:hypothetical protein BU17DRAFT_69734 [Hysterangium stoloniferum]|nr:hypothetical protein BU17DRAFT_69734 [Hysterangium stoloniferum]